jgi:8-oxo-dGTP pyrophosphatase MutT (NUDIX family)
LTAASNGRRVLLTPQRAGGGPKLAHRASVPDSQPDAENQGQGGDVGAAQGDAGQGATAGPGWALQWTRGHTARRAALEDVVGRLRNRLAHVEMLERKGWEVAPWEEGNLAGLHLGAQLVAAGGTDQDVLAAALLRGPKDGGSDENVGFQSGMRSAALALQQGGHPDLSAYGPSPSGVDAEALPDLGDMPSGKASLEAGEPRLFDVKRVDRSNHQGITVEDPASGQLFKVRKLAGKDLEWKEAGKGLGGWKKGDAAQFEGHVVVSGKQGQSGQSSLPGFGDLWQPSKPKPFDPKRAHVGQRVRDMQGNELEVTRVTNSKQTITLKDEMGEMTIPFGSLPPLDLVPEGGKSWSKGSSVSKAQSDDGVWEVGGYAGKQGSGRWATGPDGVRAVVKDHGGDRDRVATERLANSVYRELGIEVPTLGATTVKGKDATVSNEVEGATKEGFPVSSRELGAGFMADALLANWDVVGKDGKHILWRDGKPVRVDQSQALMYRGQGKKKPFGDVPTEVWSMNSPKSDAFFAMLTTPEDRKAQAQHIAATLTDSRVDELVNDAGFADTKMGQEVRDALKARVAWMRDYADGKVEEPQPLVGQEARDEFRQGQEGLNLLPEQHAGLETFLTDPEVFSDKGGRRFLPGEEVEADAIGGPPLVAVEEPDWEKHEDVALPAPSGPSFEDAAGKTGSSLKQSAGVIVQEPDGRIWTFEPKGHFGGYERTLSKGRVDEGQTEQQAALRELWEETGLVGEITGDVGWYRGTTTMTHYFTARRTGGAPWAHDGHETAAVYLQAPEVAAAALQERDVNALRDAGIAHGHAEGLDSLLRHSRTREDTVLYVALPIAPGDESLVGKTLRDRGYLDASTDAKAAARKGKAVLKVLAPAGSNLLYTRGVQGFEKAKGPEVIGQRGARLRVVGQRTEGGKVVLDAVLVP